MKWPSSKVALHNAAVSRRLAKHMSVGDPELVKGVLGPDRVVVLTEEDLTFIVEPAYDFPAGNGETETG